MEVHHHSHHGKKKWTEYIWEFLMLFLAVFCGFLAENLREHKIERDREKQYLHNLLEDLKEDTLALEKAVEEYRTHIDKNDTLLRLLTRFDVRAYGSDLYFLARRASRSVRFAIHDATIQQRKNSGGFRMIRNAKISKAIVEYYNRMVFLQYLQTIESNEADEYRKQASEIFHPVIFNDIVIPDNTIIRPAGNPALLTYETKPLMKLAGMVSYIRNTKLGLAKAETEMKAAAAELIELIKKEYHLH